MKGRELTEFLCSISSTQLWRAENPTTTFAGIGAGSIQSREAGTPLAAEIAIPPNRYETPL